VTRDQLATAVVVLEYLEQVGLGPPADHADVATALDDVAIACSPQRDIAVNPGKMLAISLADANPVVWGGSSLAARAARRVSETVRRASGRSAVAGDAEHLLPLIEAARPRDVFDDPFAEGGGEPRPVLLVFDDGADDPVVREDRGRLQAAATQHGVRTETVTSAGDTEVARYASLVLSGRYGAEYLRLGLVDD
jgi:Bacterial phospho-glucose isomerase C-terminal SIS domain